MPLFLKNGYFYIHDKKEQELDEYVYSIGWFIISQLKNCSPIDNLESIESLAKCWHNTKLYDCSYNEQINNSISEMEKNMFTTSAIFKHN